MILKLRLQVARLKVAISSEVALIAELASSLIRKVVLNAISVGIANVDDRGDINQSDKPI